MWLGRVKPIILIPHNPFTIHHLPTSVHLKCKSDYISPLLETLQEALPLQMGIKFKPVTVACGTSRGVEAACLSESWFPFPLTQLFSCSVLAGCLLLRAPALALLWPCLQHCNSRPRLAPCHSGLRAEVFSTQSKLLPPLLISPPPPHCLHVHLVFSSQRFWLSKIIMSISLHVHWLSSPSACMLQGQGSPLHN